MALMTPVILIGGMTHGLVHADGSRGRRRDLVAVPRPGALPLDDHAHARQGDASTRSRRRPRCCSSSPPPRSSPGCSPSARRRRCCPTCILALTENKWVFLILVNLLMLFVGCFLDTIAAITILVPILLPIVAQARHRPGPFRPDHDAQPDDRPAAPAARHGAVRAVARRQALGRAHHHGDPALAGAAVRRADR